MDEMVELGLEPDRQSFILAIEACGEQGRYEEANHLLGYMKDAEHELDEEVYSFVIRACETAKNWRQLMWTFDEMQIRNLVPPLVSYNRAIGGCGEEGEWEMALSLVLEAAAGDRRGSLTPDYTSFQLAMNALHKAKQAVRAHDLLTTMKDAGFTPEKEILQMVLDLLLEVEESDRAEEVRRSLDRGGLGG